MQTTESVHAERPWLVHRIASDFTLEDLWTFDLGEDEANDIEEFLPAFWKVLGGSERSTLAQIRLRVGRALGWDDHDFSLPIPGCTEKSVGERLEASDRTKNRAREDAASPVASPTIKTAYVLERDALYEVSNDTIHALLHIAVVGKQATLAVYVKSRGISSRLYMAAIWPARHLFLYPALVRKIERGWRSRNGAVATSS
jgi:hypothetical protein